MDTLASPARAPPVSGSSVGYAHTPIKPSARTHVAQSTATEPLQDDAPHQQNLWSSILNSVNSSKAVSTRNLVVLGEPNSGKSSLISALASTSPGGLISGKSSYPPDDKALASTSRHRAPSNNLGLSYAYFDVGDERDRDEIVARVGAYTLYSSQPAYTSLLPFAFPQSNSNLSEQDTAAAMQALASATISSSSTATTASPQGGLLVPKASIDSLKDSIVVILLDWEQPWTFLEQLRNWLNILRDLVDNAAGGTLLSQQQQRDAKWSRTRVALDEMKERLEAYIRAYVEPPHKVAESSAPVATEQVNGSATTELRPAGESDPFPTGMTNVSVQLDGTEANPLAEGTLTDNFGVPIVVVCTKADAIARLERDKEFKEEQFDYIQQVLRTICMKYGAALFYTSSLRSQSIDILRSYLLHRLFTPAAASNLQQQQSNASGSTSTATSAPNSAAAGGVAVFGFPYRASTTDRDTLIVPAGWDSWGKIKALREPFDCHSMAKGWDNDCEIERLRRARGLAKTKEVEDQLEKELQAERRGDASLEVANGDEVQSAMKLYEDVVSDWEAEPVGKDATNKVRIPDEQTFLSQHHATLQKDPDPRSKFSKRGVVGPMTGSSAGLPSVERYMSREAKAVDGATSPNPSGATETTRTRLETSSSKQHRDSTSAAAAAAVAAMTGGAGGADRNSRPSSPAVSPGATSPGAPKQSEVLHSFFQSLLKDKGSGVGSPKIDRLNRTSSSSARREPPPSSSSAGK